MYKLRDLNQADKNLLLEWRNSDFVRKYLFSPKKITKTEHKKWFNDFTNSIEKKGLILLYDEEAVGFMQIKFEKKNKRATWGFYKSPMHKKHIGNIFAKLGVKYIFENTDAEEIIGEVKAENINSINFHINIGFTEIERKRKIILDQETLILIFKLEKEFYYDNYK